MRLLLFFLAIAGFLAVARQLTRATFVLLKRSVDSFVLREVAGERARRGDVTGLVEAHAAKRERRRGRLFALLAVIGWTALLALPLSTRATLPGYALYSVFWIVPLLRRRRL
jgi:hypothetical protein